MPQLNPLGATRSSGIIESGIRLDPRRARRIFWESYMYRNLSTQALSFYAPQNEQIEMALSYGFRGMDIDLLDYGQQVEARGEKMARRLIDSANIELGCFRLPLDLEADDTKYKTQLTRLGGLAQYAAALGVRRAVTFVAPANDSRPMHDNFERYRQRLSEIGQLFVPLELQLGVGFNAVAEARAGKTFEFIYTFDALTKLIDAVKSPAVGYCLDLWQNYISGAGVAEIKALPLEKIVAVRISGAPAGVEPAQLREQDRLVPTANGPIQLPKAIEALVEMGYEGPVSPAVHGPLLAGKRRDEVVRVVGEAIDEVWVAAGLPAFPRFIDPFNMNRTQQPEETIEVPEELLAEEPEESKAS